MYIVNYCTLKRIATIGFFDGVHTGHRYLFEQLLRLGAERDMRPLIVTFDVHPRSVLQSDYMPQLLTTADERRNLLSRYGEVLMLSFREVQPLTAEAFMRLLHEQYDVAALLMGYDHMFGSDRLRRPQEYRQAGAASGVEVLGTGEFTEGEWHVSSTEIRAALTTGNIAVANELLGRPYSLSGTVVHGKGIGRTLGFPTANIVPNDPNKIIPKAGVYAVQVNTPTMNNAPAFLNIGTNPTVNSQLSTLNYQLSIINYQLSIEVHIPSFKGDLYGQELELQFLQFLREEKQFESMEALRTQIKADIDSILRRA